MREIRHLDHISSTLPMLCAHKGSDNFATGAFFSPGLHQISMPTSLSIKDAREVNKYNTKLFYRRSSSSLRVLKDLILSATYGLIGFDMPTGKPRPSVFCSTRRLNVAFKLQISSRVACLYKTNFWLLCLT